MAGTVIAGIVFVIPLLFPSMVYPRTWAARTQCKNNLKQIGLAFHNYYDVYQLFPPARISKPSKSWRVNLLPFMEGQELYEEYDESSAWDSPVNHPLTLTRVNSLMCPGRPQRTERNQQGQYLTSYTVPAGPQSIFDGSQQVGFRKIEDGLSNTLMVVESCGTDIVWSEPRDSVLTKTAFSVNAGTGRIDRSSSLLSSYHRGMAQALLADGSVRAVGEQIDADVLQALISKSGREDVGDDW